MGGGDTTALYVSFGVYVVLAPELGRVPPLRFPPENHNLCKFEFSEEMVGTSRKAFLLNVLPAMCQQGTDLLTSRQLLDQLTETIFFIIILTNIIVKKTIFVPLFP